jgi:hypothetical protein
MKSEEPKKQQTPRDPRAWVRPTLKPLGSMRDKILGAGKAGSNLDGDPRGTFKTGAG